MNLEVEIRIQRHIPSSDNPVWLATYSSQILTILQEQIWINVLVHSCKKFPNSYAVDFSDQKMPEFVLILRGGVLVWSMQLKWHNFGC